MSEEPRPAETIAPEQEAGEPKFNNCWTDSDREIIEVDCGGIKFRLRSITVGEERRIADEMNIRYVLKHDRESGKLKFDIGDELTIIVAENKGKAIFTIAAALGAWNKYGTEGWTDPRPVTIENVEALKGDVLDKLYSEYAKYFRGF